MKRDIAERGRDLNGVLAQYTRFVKPSFDSYIRPTMRHADVIIPRGADNFVAIELLAKHIARQLDDRGFSIRSRLARLSAKHGENPNPSKNVVQLEMTPQLKFIHTMLRDNSTSRDDFIFYAERVSRLIVERSLSELEFDSKVVTTPTGSAYKGLVGKQKICGVSIIRAGLCMEKPLRKVCPYICLGRLLIQNSPTSNEPHLHFCSLPDDIGSQSVLLMDATIGTGAAMVMAIQVLLEHGVQEGRIIVLCLIGSCLGINIITSCFPQVKVVVSDLDALDTANNNYFLVPGCGNFGDRYFGTEA